MRGAGEPLWLFLFKFVDNQHLSNGCFVILAAIGERLHTPHKVVEDAAAYEVSLSLESHSRALPAVIPVLRLLSSKGPLRMKHELEYQSSI